jgi:uncharacterized membrane protein SpoIIM required for sporulation
VIFKRLTDTPMAERGLWWRAKMIAAMIYCLVIIVFYWLVGNHGVGRP